MQDDGTDAYYNRLFQDDPTYSTPYPNVEESRRWAKIGEFLSRITAGAESFSGDRLRILDVGCGRGWMTKLASIFGQCEGIDPVAGVVDYAKRLFPDLTLRSGTVDDLIGSPGFSPYDVILCSEVLEHVQDQDAFVASLHDCLRPGGHLIVTTPRGELFAKYHASGYDEQPVEAWITERDLEALFFRHGFRAIHRDRVYDDLPKLSFLHRLATSRKLEAALRRTRLSWAVKGLQHCTAVYQVWCFEKQSLQPASSPNPHR